MAYFYKYQNNYFIFAKDAPEFEKEKNKIFLFKDVNDAKLFQKFSGNKTAVISSSPETISFWTKKKINYIINPFNFYSVGFDKNIFSQIIQNKIQPMIILDKLIINDKDKQLKIFKHLFLFIKLCKKYKLPVIILSEDLHATKALYHILGYNEQQAKNFLSGFNEKKN